jgi:hypothetical protein
LRGRRPNAEAIILSKPQKGADPFAVHRTDKSDCRFRRMTSMPSKAQAPTKLTIWVGVEMVRRAETATIAENLRDVFMAHFDIEVRPFHFTPFAKILL